MQRRFVALLNWQLLHIDPHFYPMAILELDKIIIKKPDTGIHCMNCGGDLLQTHHPLHLPEKIIAWVTLGNLKIIHYQCENCKKKYIVL